MLDDNNNQQLYHSYGFRFHLTMTQVRTPANTPTLVEIELPIGCNLVSYYGERSGELGHYISQVTPSTSGGANSETAESNQVYVGHQVAGTVTYHLF